MTKMLLTAMILVGSFQAHADLTVETENPQTPLVINITGSRSTDYETYYYDANGKTRLSYYLSGSTCQLSSFNSETVQISSQEETGATCAKVVQALSTAQAKAPVTVTIDRSTLKIIDIKSKTDYLSQGTVQNHEG